jgi:hypothetical protein
VTEAHELPDETDTGVAAPVNPPALLTGLKTAYNDWLAAYRGLVPHGVRSPAPEQSDLADEPPTFYDDEYAPVQADPDPFPPDFKDMVALPVVVLDDRSGIARTTETYFRAYQEVVGVTPKLIVSRDNNRTMVRLSNIGPSGTCYLSPTESETTTGYPLVVNEAINGASTRDYWACTSTGTVTIGIYTEYVREIE